MNEKNQVMNNEKTITNFYHILKIVGNNNCAPKSSKHPKDISKKSKIKKDRAGFSLELGVGGRHTEQNTLSIAETNH